MQEDDIYNFWYKQNYILLEIVKQLRGRETCFYDAQAKRMWRCIKAHSLHYLQQNFKSFMFFKKRYKLYHSLAYLENMPVFSFNAMERKKQQEIFIQTFKNYAKGYDFALDIDGEKGKPVTKRSKVYKEAKKVKEELDSYELPIVLKFSGSKGFHFSIPYYYMPNWKFSHLVEVCKKVAHNLKVILNLDCLDDSIYDDRRIFKVAYSLDTGHTDKFNYVVLPLSDEQFEDFDIEMCRADNVLKNIKIKNRGLLIRNGTKKNVEQFLKDWSGD